MSIFKGTTEPKKIYYIANMPDTFTKTFTNYPNTDIYESGYTISSITIEASMSRSDSGGWNSDAYGIGTSTSDNNYNMFFRSGAQRGYSGYVGPYGGIFNFYPSDICYCAFPRSATTRYKASGIFTLNTTGASVKVGQDKGTWLYENSWTYTSSESSLVNGILSSPDVILTVWNSGITTELKATVTYTAL